MIARSRTIRLLAFIAGLVLGASPLAAQYVDTSTGCLQCHETGLRQNDFCPTISGEIWSQDDKHRRAFWLLHETDRSDPQKGAAKRELIRRILGFDLREAFTDERYVRLTQSADAETARKVATVKLCLRCHATWPKEADEKYSLTPPVPLDLGVSCQACHGPGEKWEQPHRIKAWRLVTPAAKAELGFADCRSSIAKAQLCASCHVGSVAQEKFVKHEWYAAGHPPLPSFELAAFETQMPAHWRSLRDKGPFELRDAAPRDDVMLDDQIASLRRMGVPAEAVKASYREANSPLAAAKGLDPCSDLARTKDAIVGGAAVLEIYLRLVGEYAAQAADNKAAWPELAIYDCAACHHELRSGLSTSLRPKRTHAQGRPPLAVWPLVLAQLAAQQASHYDEAEARKRWFEVNVKLLELDRATTDRPFGDAKSMRAAAGPLIASVHELAHDAANSSFDEAAARKALALLTDTERYEVHDFFTVRQAAWTIRAVANDLRLRDGEQLFLRGVEDPLALSLPSGPSRSVMQNLERWLRAAANYNPGEFRGELNVIRARLRIE